MQIMAINHSWEKGRDKFWCVSYHHSSYKCLVSIGKANPSIHLCSAAASSPHIHNPHLCIKIFSQIWAQSREGDMCNIFWEIWSGSSAMWKENKINIRWKRYLVKEIIDCLRRRYANIYADQEFSHLYRLRELIKHLSFFSAMFYWGLILMDIPNISNWYQERILKLLSYLWTSY